MRYVFAILATPVQLVQLMSMTVHQARVCKSFHQFLFASISCLNLTHICLLVPWLPDKDVNLTTQYKVETF